MKGIGVDIVELTRLNIDNEHFIKRVLSKEELQQFSLLKSDQRKREYLGGRFAVKEAYLKAKGLGLGGISFQDISVLNDENGAPYLNDSHALVSISHEKEMVIGFVVIKD